MIDFCFDSTRIQALDRSVTRGGRGVVFPALFRKLEKVPKFWEKIPLLLSSMGKISHLKLNFKSFQAKKPEIFSLHGLSLSCCR